MRKFQRKRSHFLIEPATPSTDEKASALEIIGEMGMGFIDFLPSSRASFINLSNSSEFTSFFSTVCVIVGSDIIKDTPSVKYSVLNPISNNFLFLINAFSTRSF